MVTHEQVFILKSTSYLKNDKNWKIMKRKMTKWYLMPVALVIGFFIGLFGLMIWLIR